MRVTNKARVEGSIVEVTIVKEISTFCSNYFEEKPQNGQQRVTQSNPSQGGLSIFYNAGRPVNGKNKIVLDVKDYKAAHYYVIHNCLEIHDKYEREFDADMLNSGTRSQELDKVRQDCYGDWLRTKVLSDDDCDKYIRKVGVKLSKTANCYEVYDISGYRFHTENYGKNKATKSSGVCIKGEWDENGEQHDYYGILQEVIELNYDGGNKVALFRCIWFDITNEITRDKKHGIVEVKHTSRLKGFEPYVLECQAIQVVYVLYASDTRERRLWWVAMKTSPKGKFRVDEDFDENLEFYQDEKSDNPVLEPNEEGFSWNHVVIRENKYEIVDDAMDTSHAPPTVADNENPIERDEGDEGDDTEQEYDMHEVEEGLGWFNQDDESDEDW